MSHVIASRIAVRLFSWPVDSLGNAQNQIELVVMSAGLARWNAYVVHQPVGLATRNGAFTTRNTPTPEIATRTAPRQSRAATRSRTSGARNSPG
jgi:hypothetical protein